MLGNVCAYCFIPPEHGIAWGGQSQQIMVFVYRGGSDARQCDPPIKQTLSTTQQQRILNIGRVGGKGIMDFWGKYFFGVGWDVDGVGVGFKGLGLVIIFWMKGEGNIKVFCRFRPFNAKETDNNPTRLHRIQKSTQLIIKDSKMEDCSFMFDHVFDMDSTQEEVFDKVGEPVLKNILDGFNGTIMAYGQTSSGKTHTMQGYDLSEKDNRGIMPRIIENLFSAIEKSPENVEFKLKVAIFEIYMEKIRDLLQVSKTDLKIRESKQGYYIENLTQVYVGEKIELFRIISIGQKNRMTCATNMNEHSSRSHLIFLLTLNQVSLTDGASKTSKLFLIDLAGSEKISKTGAEGKVLEQAKKINLSLTNLGKVIKSLAEKGEKGGHIPYRDSKLTRILKDSLGGNSKTTLIVACSPHEMHLPETITTLRFGQNAQKVKNKPKINRQLTVQQLQKIIDKYEVDIKEKDKHIKFLQDYITSTAKLQLPVFDSKPQLKSDLKSQERQQLDLQSQQPSFPPQKQSTVFDKINEQVQQRVKNLQEQLSSYQTTMKIEMQKYYQVKKEYHDLRDHLTSILTENIELKQKMEEKQSKQMLSDKNILNNANLIRMILGEIFSYLPEDIKCDLINIIKESHWYQKIMEEGIDCVDFWQKEKEKIQREFQAFYSREDAHSEISQESARAKIMKDNEKIAELEEKIAELEERLRNLLEEYELIKAHQTHWKAECQIYERNLRKKEEDILKLQKQVEKLQQLMQQMYIYDQNDDTISVKSSRLIKPLKGGFVIR